MQPCGYCGKDVPQLPGKRTREFCNNVCRQLAYRKRKQQGKPPATFRQQHQADQDAALSAELAALRTRVATLEQENEEQASLISKLQRHLDVERRFLEDTDKHPFKKFLKEQSSSPWRTAFLSHQLIKALGTRAHYDYAMNHLLHLREEEHDDFVRLWKLMLLQS